MAVYFTSCMHTQLNSVYMYVCLANVVGLYCSYLLTVLEHKMKLPQLITSIANHAASYFICILTCDQHVISM